MLWLQHMSYGLDEALANYTHDVSRCASSEPDLRSPTYFLCFLVKSENVLLYGLFFAFSMNRQLQDKRRDALEYLSFTCLYLGGDYFFKISFQIFI